MIHMNNDRTILIQLNESGEINWGAAQYSTSDETLRAQYPQSRKWPLMFKYVEIEQKSSSFEQTFRDLMTQTRRVINVIQNQSNPNGYAMTVEAFTPEGVVLRPDDESWGILRFIIPLRYYNSEYEWWPLEAGDRIMAAVTKEEFGTIECRVVRTLYRVNKKAPIIKAKARQAQYEADIRSMAGKVTINAKIHGLSTLIDKRTGKERSFNTLEIGGEVLPGIYSLSWYPTYLTRKKLETGTNVRLWVDKRQTITQENSEEESSTETQGSSFIWRISTTPSRMAAVFRYKNPTKLPEAELQTVTGIVCCYSSQNSPMLLWAAFDNWEWGGTVFRNQVDLQGLGPKIFTYLPLGFPAQFTFDYILGESGNIQNSRLRLLGFSPQIAGRVSTNYEAQNVQDRELCSMVMVSPYARLDDDTGTYITSPQYAGTALDKNTPSAMIKYAQSRIFTTEYQVPAKVKLRKRTVYFDIKSALQQQLTNLRGKIGELIDLKICAISNGWAYMTTRNGYPVAYRCMSDLEVESIRQNMFSYMEFRLERITGDQLEVSSVGAFKQQVTQLSLQPGTMIDTHEVERDENDTMTWNKLTCIQIKSETPEMLQEAPYLMIVEVDERNCRLIVTAQPKLYKEPITMVRRMSLSMHITPTLWSCTDCNGHQAIMEASRAESHLLTNLMKLYGPNIPVFVGPTQSGFGRSAVGRCKFEQIACSADYSQMLALNPIQISTPMSKQNPRVLYYDVVLTCNPDELKNGPVSRVVYTGQVDDLNALICKPDYSENNTVTNRSESSSKRYMGYVLSVDTSTHTVLFFVDSKEVQLSTEHQLHIPLNMCAPLDTIFPVESTWSIIKNGDEYELNNHCSRAASAYTLIRQHTRQNKRHRDWVVKGEDGTIAVAAVQGWQAGETLLLIPDTSYGETDFCMMVEAEELIIGRNITLRLCGVSDDGAYYLVEPVRHSYLRKNYQIPISSWNWCDIKPLKNFEMIKDCVFDARVVDIDDDTIILDRQQLLPQCNLLQNDRISGIYQMEVVGYNQKGYILEQYQIKALLPWEKASWFHLLPGTSIIEEYLPIGSLIAVGLSTPENLEQPYLDADWIGLHADIEKRWKKAVEDQSFQSLVVQRVGKRHLYVSLDGIIMPLGADELGVWEGLDLSDYYSEEQCLNDGLLQWLVPQQRFQLRLAEKRTPCSKPELDLEYTATIKSYRERHSHACYVAFDEWVAIVPHGEVTWEPCSLDKRPYEIGATVRIKVTSANTNTMKIKASIKACLPRPESGPAAINAAEHPEMRWFTLDRASSVDLQLLDKYNVPAILCSEDATQSLDEIKSTIAEQGGIYLPVVGVKQGMLHCNQKVIKTQAELLQRRLEKGSLKITCVICGLTNSRLFVHWGVLTGSILKHDIIPQNVVSLKHLYKEGETIACVVSSIDMDTCLFKGSVLSLYPNGIYDLLDFKKSGDVTSVLVLGANETGVKVQHSSGMIGMIPLDEVSWNPNADIQAWAERFENDYVGVVVLNIDHSEETNVKLIFSRKRRLAEGVED